MEAEQERLINMPEPPCGDCRREEACVARIAFDKASTYSTYLQVIGPGFIKLEASRTFSCAAYEPEISQTRRKAPPLISSRSRSKRVMSVAGELAVRNAATPWREQGHQAAKRRQARNNGMAAPGRASMPEGQLGEIPDVVSGARDLDRYRNRRPFDW